MRRMKMKRVVVISMRMVLGFVRGDIVMWWCW